MPVLVRENYWVLETDHTAYAFGVTPRGLLTETPALLAFIAQSAA